MELQKLKEEARKAKLNQVMDKDKEKREKDKLQKIKLEQLE